MLGVAAWLLLSTVTAAPTDLDLVVFVAPTCPHCAKMAPELEELKREGHRVQIIDAVADRPAAMQLKIERVPTLLVFQGGNEISRVEGSQNREQLLKLLNADAGSEAKSIAPFPPLNTPARAASISDTEVAPRNPTQSISDQARGLENSISNGVTTASFNQPALPSNRPAASLATNSNNSLPSRLPANESVESTTSPRAVPNPTDIPRSLAIDPRVAQQRALAATVRLRIENPTSQANGSGTVIYSDGTQGLILTCGHIFRDMSATDELFVDFYHQGQWHSAPGKVLAFLAKDQDIGIVQCDLPLRVEAVGMNYSTPLAKGASVFTIGCDRGSPPNIQQTRIVALNRYQGAANIEVDGAPVDGRSGGGLFDEYGHLIGICNAADHQDNQGIYAGQAQIAEQLRNLNLNIPSVDARLMTATDGDNSAASITAASLTQPSSASDRSATIPAKPLGPTDNLTPSVAGGSISDSNGRIAAEMGTESITDIETTRGQTENLTGRSPESAQPELIMILRDGKNPPREVRVRQPSPDLLRMFSEQASAAVPTTQWRR